MGNRGLTGTLVRISSWQKSYHFFATTMAGISELYGVSKLLHDITLSWDLDY